MPSYHSTKMSLYYIHETYLATMLQSFCSFFLGQVYDINMADLGTKLIEKLNEMMCLSAVVSIVWCSN